MVENVQSAMGATLTEGEEAPPLAAEAFLANWADTTVGDLFERMRATMPQNDPGKLSSQRYADILAFILSVNKFPVGNSEMGTQAELLRHVRIEAIDTRLREIPGPSTTPIQDGKSTVKSETPAAGKDAGKQLFASVGCGTCHGGLAKGGAGPRISPPPLPLPEFVKFVRQPSGTMRPFFKSDVSDAQLADIYAFLRSLSQSLNSDSSTAGAPGGNPENEK